MKRSAVVAALAVLAAGCGGGAANHGSQGLIAALKDEGVTAASPQPVQAGILDIRSTRYRVPGGVLQVYTFVTGSKAKVAAARIHPDGYTIATPSGIMQVVDFAAPPHWFRDGREVVVYLGRDTDVLDALQTVSGPQIAGA